MMRLNKILLHISVLVTGLLTACSDGFEAFEGSGEIITVQRDVSTFHTIILNDNIDLNIEYDSVCSLRIEAPENWMDEIVSEVNNQALTLRNTGKWLWLKDPNKKITVYLRAPTLKGLKYYGAGYVDTQDTIRAGLFLLEAMDGSGNISLIVKTDSLYLKNMDGTADLRAEGFTDYLYVFNSTVSPVDCRELESNIARVINKGTNSCFIHTRKILNVSITGKGDVYFTGDPDTIVTSITGSGQLIPF